MLDLEIALIKNRRITTIAIVVELCLSVLVVVLIVLLLVG